MGRLEKLLHQMKFEDFFAALESCDHKETFTSAYTHLYGFLDAHPDLPDLSGFIARAEQLARSRYPGVPAGHCLKKLLRALLAIHQPVLFKSLFLTTLDHIALFQSHADAGFCLRDMCYLVPHALEKGAGSEVPLIVEMLARSAASLEDREKHTVRDKLKELLICHECPHLIELVDTSICNPLPSHGGPATIEPNPGGIDTDAIRRRSASAEPVAESDFHQALKEHSLFLRDGNPQASWQVFTVASSAIGMYMGDEGGSAPQLDLSRKNLSALTLRRKKMAFSNLFGVCCRNKNLRGIDISGSLATDSDFSGCDFRGADLRSVDFSRTLLRDCDFRGANLCLADLECADLSGSDMRGTDVTGARFPFAILADVKSGRLSWLERILYGLLAKLW